eukprot:5180888-Amphidinium_carterae.1
MLTKAATVFLHKKRGTYQSISTSSASAGETLGQILYEEQSEKVQDHPGRVCSHSSHRREQDAAEAP